MHIACVIGCLTIPILNFIMKKKVLLIGSFFSLYWGIILLLSYLALYNVDRPNDKTFLMIFLGVLFFEIGCLIISIIGNNKVIKRKFELNIDIKIFWIMCFICCLFIIPDLRKFIYVLTNHVSISEIYSDYIASDTYREYLYGTTLQYALQEYVGYPIMYSIMVVSIVAFFQTKNKLVLIPGPFFTAVCFCNNGQRTVIVIYMLLFLTCTLFLGIFRKNTIFKNKKRIIGLLLIALLVFVLFYTMISRRRSSGDDYSFFENLYKYYVGCVRYFDLRLENWNNSGLNYSNGFFTFRGIVSPFVKVLEFMGIKIDAFDFATENFYSMHLTTFDIGGGSMYNTYGTCFFTFFADFGVGGIIILSLLYGIVSAHFLKSMIIRKTNYSIAAFSYFFATIILFSNLTIYSTVIHIIYGLVFIRVFFHKTGIMNSYYGGLKIYGIQNA